MLSKEQQLKKDINILKATSQFISHPSSIKEVALKTGLTPSSVQRYLNDKRVIVLLGKETYEEIQNNLKRLKLEAVKKGGFISTQINEATKDEHGKFTGNKKR